MKATETKDYVIIAIKPKVKTMYKTPWRTKTSINLNTSVEGETIEQEVSRLINDGTPIEHGKMQIYTKPSDGVLYGTDIRNDKWEKALEISDKINDDIDRIRNLKVVKDEPKEEPKGDNNSAKTGEE